MIPSKRIVLAGLTGVAITLGAAGVANAASSTNGPGGGHKPTWTSSVTIAEPTAGTRPTDAQLQAAAKITSDAASAAARVKVPGTVKSVSLRDVGGNVVYVVDVTATAGGEYHVVIDAGNAAVLDSHTGGVGRGDRGDRGRGGTARGHGGKAVASGTTGSKSSTSTAAS